MKNKLLAKPIERMIAFFLDWIILSFFGFIFLIISGKSTIEYWPISRVAGFFIAWIYFGLQESKLTRGQTIGKKIIGIRTIEYNGTFLSYTKAFARSFLLIFPFFFNQISIPGIANNYMIAIFIFLAVFLIGIGNIFLCFANKHSMQGLHDILLKTLVIKGDWKPEIGKFQASQKAVFIYSIIVIALITANVVSASKLLRDKTFIEMIRIQKNLDKLPNVKMAYVEIIKPSENKNKKESLSSKIRYNIQIIWGKVLNKSNENDNEINHIKKAILKELPTNIDKNNISISLINFFDIGFFNFRKVYTLQITKNNR